jgi:hypothetical protein
MPLFQPQTIKGSDTQSIATDKPPSSEASSPPEYRPRPPVEVGQVKQAETKPLRTEDTQFADKVRSYFGQKGRTTRAMVETDKPLYRPGEWIWFRVVLLDLKGNERYPGNVVYAEQFGLQFELIDPRGNAIQKGYIILHEGHAQHHLPLAANIVGGEYTIRVKEMLSDVRGEKKVLISAYQPPLINKKLEFLRKGYGASDTAQATITLHRATGAPIASQEISMIASLDGRPFRRWSQKTNQKGEALIAFKLPKALNTDDGLLTVMISDGGVTESISRPIPLVLQQIRLGFFPEGGKTILGLSNRIYFAARRPSDDKPVDISGIIKDQTGKIVAKTRSFHDGMGRFSYTPQPNHRYHLEITQPVGIAGKFSLPTAAKYGIAMQIVDDFRSQRGDLRLFVHSHSKRDIVVTAMQYETLLAHQAYTLSPGKQWLSLPLKWQAQGVVRVTVWTKAYRPLAERLVFRHLDRGLNISIMTNQKHYQPRDRVAVRIQVRDLEGEPIVGANLGIAVVDDAVLSFADDHEPHFLSQRYLTTQLTGKIHKPNFYFDPQKPKAWRALDLVMATHGWRDFSWREVRTGQAPAARIDLNAWRQQYHARYNAIFNNARKAILEQNKPWYDIPKADREWLEQHRIPPWEPRAQIAKDQPVQVIAKDQKRPSEPKSPKPKAKLEKPKTTPAVKPKPDRQVGGIGKPPADGPKIADRPQAATPPAAPPAVEEQRPRQAPARHLRHRQVLNFGGAQAGERVAPNADALAVRRAPAQEAQGGRRKPFGWKNVRRFGDDARQWEAERQRRQAAAKYHNWNRWSQQFHRQYYNPMQPQWAYSRQYPIVFYHHKGAFTGQRTDFRETVFWSPRATTDVWGEVNVIFSVGDSITSYRVSVSGVGNGLLGMKSKTFASKRPFYAAVTLPLEVSAGDAMALPLTLRNDTDRALLVKVQAQFDPIFKLMENPLPSDVKLDAHQATTYFYPVRVTGRSGDGKISFVASSEGLSDSFSQQIAVRPRGFPREIAISGMLDGKNPQQFAFHLPKDISQASPEGEVNLYPNPLSSMIQGMAGMLRQPYGCFEQASSTNYPNVMILQYLQERGVQEPEVARRASQFLSEGYRRLSGYETTSKGYEWFGRAPAHEALTAYGLMQFVEMKQVYPQVNADMISRTSRWLLSRRDGKGGYQRNARALDSFGRAEEHITNAYITFALTQAGQTDLERELRWLESRAIKSNDPYFLSLVINSLLKTNSSHKTAPVLLKKLLTNQNRDGSFDGQTHSVTRSTGHNLTVETTALATLAMLQAQAPTDSIQRAIRWLNSQRAFGGGFGATQATILTLRAIIEYDRAHRKPQAPGQISVSLNERPTDSTSYDTSITRPISLQNFLTALAPGENKINIDLRSNAQIAFGFGLRYYTFLPASHPKVSVSLSTELSQTKARMGETIRLTATLRNKTNQGLPMVLARIAFPGALQPQAWQLKEMREKNLLDFYETNPREIIVYYSSMAPNDTKTLHFDLTARITGNYSGPPSSAYLYYTDNKKFYAEPLYVSILP